MMRQPSRRNAFRRGDKALRPGERLQAQGIDHRLGLHQVEIFQVTSHIHTLAGEHGSERGGQHKHVLVKAQRDIRHDSSFRRSHDTENAAPPRPVPPNSRTFRQKAHRPSPFFPFCQISRRRERRR